MLKDEIEKKNWLKNDKKINYHVNTANPQNLWEKSQNRDNFIEKNKKIRYNIQ
jgi:hypothetical protein